MFELGLGATRMETKAYIQRILSLRDEGVKKAGHFEYGANVLPVIKHYLNLQKSEERRLFLAAVEEMLRSGTAEQKEYAVTLCLGFVTFRDAV